MSVSLLQTHEENILPYTVKIDSARALTTFSRNFRFFAIWKSLKMPEWNLSNIHGTCMNKIVYTNSQCNDHIITVESCLIISNIFTTLMDLQCASSSDIRRM